jgi:hypothetical protein
MVNWILENLPVFVNIDCSNSKSLEFLILSPVTGFVFVKMTSGSAYSVPVSRWNMLKIRQYENPGEWLNKYAVTL